MILYRFFLIWFVRFDLFVVVFYIIFIKCVVYESILYYVLNVIWLGIVIMNEVDVLGILVNNIVYIWWWEVICIYVLILSFYYFDILFFNCVVVIACKNIFIFVVL